MVYETPDSITAERFEAKVDHVVILVHGIRTEAAWQITLRSELEKCGVKVELTNYGYFDAVRFLLPVRWVRERAIKRVWTLIRDVRKMYPGAQISFLAHSFGTFIVSQILIREFDFKAHRIVFCGSIVRYDFPFHEVSERFTSPLVNDVGSADYWPAIAESVTWGYGSAGTYGFRGPRVMDRWHNKFSHSKFLTSDFCSRFWVPFFHDGKIVEADLTPDAPPFYVRLLSRIRLKYAIVICLFALVLQLLPGNPMNETATLALGGTQHSGHVTWVSAPSSPAFGEQPELTILSSTKLPSAGIELIWTMFKYPVRVPRLDAVFRKIRCDKGISEYCKPSLPVINASHLIIMNVTLDAPHHNGKIVSAPSVRLRENADSETKSSLRLTTASLEGLKSRKEDNSFIIGLSGDEDDEKKNLYDLRRYQMIEIEIEFADASHGFLLLDKGKSGQKIFNSAVEEWLQVTGRR
jgi:hypothetical protein